MGAPAPPLTATSSWNIDPVHSVAEFKVKHMMISNVQGQFAVHRGNRFSVIAEKGEPAPGRLRISAGASQPAGNGSSETSKPSM